MTSSSGRIKKILREEAQAVFVCETVRIERRLYVYVHARAHSCEMRCGEGGMYMFCYSQTLKKARFAIVCLHTPKTGRRRPFSAQVVSYQFKEGQKAIILTFLKKFCDKK
jgi:hypothetical protein